MGNPEVEWIRGDSYGGVMIDPPVGPYHTPVEISAWLVRLHEMVPSAARDAEIARAERWLSESSQSRR